MPIRNIGAINRLFTQAKVADIVSTLPKPTTPLTDMLFPASKRVQKASPFVSMADIQEVTGAVPLVTRDGKSVPVDAQSTRHNLIEVDPIKVSRFASARDINDMISLGDTESLEAYAREIIENLRNRVSVTTETMVRQAMSGKIEYPYYAENGVSAGKCEIDLGNPNSLSAVTLNAQANLGTLQKVFETLLTEHQQKAGATGTPVFLLGSDVYDKVVTIVTSVQNAPVLWTPDGMKLFGKYDFRTIAMTYTLPGSKNAVPVIGAKKIRIVDLSNTGKLIYASLDDIDAKFAPLPFYAKPIETKDPDGIKFVGEAKPLPALAMKSQSEATATIA